MSRNREVVKPVEYTESEEDDDASSGEEESDSEPEQTPQTLTQKNSAKPQQTQPPPSSSEESGSETESESDEPESIVKPKPVDEPQKSSNGAKKPAAAKRPAAEDVDVSTPKDTKKKKTNANGPETSEKKSNLFQRLFTEDDEIVLLQGMVDYKSEKKTDPATDPKGFHEFIRKKLHTDISAPQVQDKIRRLKKKYENNKGKEEKEGKARHFAKSHEQKSYDLSKLIWADARENGAEGIPKAIKTPNKNAVTVAVAGEVNSGGVVVGGGGGGSSMEEMVLKTGREAFEAGQGIEGENEWRKLRVEELKLYLKQLEIRAAQAKLVLGLVNQQDH